MSRLDEAGIAAALRQTPGWERSGSEIRRRYRLGDFRAALDFVNRVGELAEREGHHPDFHLGWGKLRLTIWTHKIDGLTESDFILAAKLDRLD